MAGTVVSGEMKIWFKLAPGVTQNLFHEGFAFLYPMRKTVANQGERLTVKTQARKFVSAMALMAVFAGSASATDINTIATVWQTYLQQCQQVFQDPRAYVSGLSEKNPGGDLTHTISPDGKAITIYNEIGDGYVEAFVDTLSDREVRHCAFYSDIQPAWDENAIAAQYVLWLGQNANLEIVGGYSPIYGYDHYRHTILGIWPAYDIEVQTNIHENEFQILSTLTVQLGS